MTGLGSAAHALSKNCAGGHCDDHASMSVDMHHADHASVEPTGSVPQGTDGVAHEGCNPFLCHVLALSSQYSEATFDQSETVLGWQVGHLSTLEEPDNPDRPPNL